MRVFQVRARSEGRLGAGPAGRSVRGLHGSSFCQGPADDQARRLGALSSQVSSAGRCVGCGASCEIVCQPLRGFDDALSSSSAECEGALQRLGRCLFVCFGFPLRGTAPSSPVV